MLREQRIKAILDAVAATETVSFTELAKLCDSSEMTIRRDLVDLEAKNLLRRIRGGAASVLPTGDPGYWQRSKQRNETKRELGRLAASMVQNGQTIFLDAGTTMTEVARAIALRSASETFSVRVVTHAVNISAEMAAVPSIAVHQMGGEVDKGTLSTVSHDLGRQISEMNFDLFFLGATGVSLIEGCTNTAPRGIEVKRAAAGKARQTWLVADASKWKVSSAYKIVDLDKLHGWVTDVEFNEEELGAFKDEGIELKLSKS